MYKRIILKYSRKNICLHEVDGVFWKDADL